VIPLRDDRSSGRFPVVTALIIAVNTAVFAYQAFFGKMPFEAYVGGYGLVPARLTAFWRGVHLSGGVFPFFTVFSATFMHGGILHLLFNMWFLWIFGDNIEATLGRRRFLLFYFVTGMISFLAHVAMNSVSKIPLVGASGAIAGVLGAYFVLFPGNKILTLVPFFLFFTVHVPAAFFLGLWFLMQFLSSPTGEPVAYYAHIGGFIAGMVLIRFFLPSRR
jgi:membrane associated rhomboid family serine protease